MVQPGPDTVAFDGELRRRLQRRRPTSSAGSPLTHFSGAGCTGFRDVPLIPTTAAVDVAPHEPGSSDLRPRYLARFDHRHERARPGDYRVTLDPARADAIGTEVTATTRVAALRLRFPRTRAASVLVDPGGAARANGLARVRVDPARREVTGEAESGSFCFQPGRYRLFFAARFDRPLDALGHLDRAAAGPRARGRRPTAPTGRRSTGRRPRPVRAPCRGTRARRRRRAPSRRSTRGAPAPSRSASRCPPSAWPPARRTLAAEAPPRRSFAALRAAARGALGRALGRVRVAGGRRADRVLMGTALYHALLHPSAWSDPDGRYRGMDGRVHRARGFTKVTNVSGWDVYRSQVQLMALLAPRHADDLAASLVADARESGCLPRWPAANVQTNVMVGDPADPILASLDAWARGGATARAALRAMVRGATVPCHTRDRRRHRARGPRRRPAPRLRALRPRGRRDGPDADRARRALGLGGHDPGGRDRRLRHRADGRAPRRRRDRPGDAAPGRAVAALLDPAARLMRPRRADGSIVPVAPDSGDGFVEGSAEQYTWLVPQDPAGLAAALGGRDVAARRLDAFFARAQRRARQRARLPRQRARAGNAVALRVARAPVADAGRRAAGAAAALPPDAGRDARQRRRRDAQRVVGVRRARALPGGAGRGRRSSSGRRCSAAPSCGCRASAPCGSTRPRRPRAALRPRPAPRRARPRRGRGCACATCAGARGWASRWARGPIARWGARAGRRAAVLPAARGRGRLGEQRQVRLALAADDREVDLDAVDGRGPRRAPAPAA